MRYPLVLPSRVPSPSLSIWPFRSNRHDLPLLAGKQFFHFGNRCVGHLLHFAGLPGVVVFTDLVILLELLEKIEAVTADVTDRHARGFGVFMRDLCDFAPPLLIEFWNAQSQDLAFGRGRQSQIGRGDRFFDGM